MTSHASNAFAVQAFLVDNSVLQQSSLGLGFRKTRNLEDKAQIHAAWFSVVWGKAVSEQWVSVNGLYLPTMIDGIRVLQPTTPGKEPAPLELFKENTRKSEATMEDILRWQTAGTAPSSSNSACSTVAGNASSDILLLVEKRLQVLQEWAASVERSRQRQLDEHIERLSKMIDVNTEKLLARLDYGSEHDRCQRLNEEGGRAAVAKVSLLPANEIPAPFAHTRPVMVDRGTECSLIEGPALDNLEAEDGRANTLSKDDEDLTMAARKSLDVDDLMRTLGWTAAKSLANTSGMRVSKITSKGHCCSCFLHFSTWCQAVTKTVGFQWGSVFLILTNAIFIALETDYRLTESFAIYNKLGRGGEVADEDWFSYVDIAFCVLFSLELGVRICSERCGFLHGVEVYWNIFDTFLVIMSIFQEIMEVANAERHLNLTFLRVLRILRVTRVMRVVRVVHAFYAMRLMLVCIIQSIMPLLWAFVFLVLIMFLVSIVLTSMVSDYVQEAPGNDHVTVAFMEQHCCTLSRTLLMLFMAITGGVGWGDVWEQLMKVSDLAAALFSFYIAFMMLGVLNIVTGIFVESATQVAKHDATSCIQAEMDRRESSINQLKEVFIACDDEHSGTLSIEEFTAHCQDPHTQAIFSSLELDTGEVMALYRLLDRSNSNEVSINEFVMGCLRLKGTATSLNFASLLYENKQGVSTICRALDALGEKLGAADDAWRKYFLSSQRRSDDSGKLILFPDESSV